MDDEEWRICVDYPDYEVSDRGQVRRLKPGAGTYAGRVLRPYHTGRHPYLNVDLWNAPLGKRRHVQVHRLVAAAFIGARPAGHEVNHLDGDQANNARTNLEYCTPTQNRHHAVRLGLAAIGQRNGQAKLTDDQVSAIRAHVAAGWIQRVVAQQFGISPNHVYRIVHGKSRSRPARPLSEQTGGTDG